MAKIGKVYLVGAGPGDPGLLTLKGKTTLERAACVVYDFLANPELLTYAPPGAETIFVGKKEGEQGISQEEINQLLLSKAREGKDVVRLKGGDPFVFGRGGEEAEALSEAGIEWEVVPGVSSGYAVPAYAGIPLTHRLFGSTVTFITGHEDPKKLFSSIDWARLAPGTGTLVFFMGARNLPEITSSLVEHGRDPGTRVSVIRWGTCPAQEVASGTLKDISEKAASLGPPALIVVGEVARLRDKLNWFEKLPLFGRRIVITRAREQANVLGDALAGLGAQVISIPTIEIRPPESWEALDGAMDRLADFEYLLVTSVHGVRNFFSRLASRGLDARTLKNVKIGAIGPGTASELEKFQIRADFVPAGEYAAEGLLEALEAKSISGKAFLIPRARVARDILPETLRKRGARVEVVEAYHTVTPELSPERVESLFTPSPSLITFTSSSTARNFVAVVGETTARRLLRGVAIAAIGPVTSATLQKLGFDVDVQPPQFTIPGLVRAIQDHFEGAKRSGAPPRGKSGEVR